MAKRLIHKVLKELKAKGSPKKAKLLAGFFKTGKGEYGEGDVFIGVTMPEVRKLLAEYHDLPIGDVRMLIRNPIHEARMLGLLILVKRYKSDPERIYKEYCSHFKWINNWDLIDLTAPQIVGAYAFTTKKPSIIEKLARSKKLWEKRIGALATFWYLRKGEDALTYKVANILLHDEHDLIQKAVGWMLREAGKRVDERHLHAFLDRHARIMPRTQLRYAIERLPEKVRLAYMKA